jgi:hypothetical protein
MLALTGCFQSVAYFDSNLEGGWQYIPSGVPEEELVIDQDGLVVLRSVPGTEGWINRVEGSISIVDGMMALRIASESVGELVGEREEQETIASYQLVGNNLCFDHCVPFTGDPSSMRRSWFRRRFIEGDGQDGPGSTITEDYWEEELRLGDDGDGDCTWVRRESSISWSDGELDEELHHPARSLECSDLELIRFGTGWIPRESEAERYRRVER